MTGKGMRLQHSLELRNFARKQLLDVNPRVEESGSTWFPGWGSPRGLWRHLLDKMFMTCPGRS